MRNLERKINKVLFRSRLRRALNEQEIDIGSLVAWYIPTLFGFVLACFEPDSLIVKVLTTNAIIQFALWWFTNIIAITREVKKGRKVRW